MEKEYIDLLEFQSRLKDGVECLFPGRVWVKAEVSAVKARSGGHCYLELSQSDASGLVAKANAIIWSSKYRFIAPYFESVTGSPIQVGMVILVEVQVNFSQLYGFSLIINDVDPEYSLGSIPQFLSTCGFTTPEPNISIQPVPLQILQPLPPQLEQVRSTSTLGSVNGKNDGLKRAFVFSLNNA